jgi:hypothetical protein
MGKATRGTISYTKVSGAKERKLRDDMAMGEGRN